MLSTIGSVAGQSDGLIGWDKYNVIITKRYYNVTNYTNHNIINKSQIGGGKEYTVLDFSEEKGYVLNLSYSRVGHTDGFYRIHSPTSATEYEFEPYMDYYRIRLYTCSESSTKTRGSLLESNVRASIGTYPADGIHTDGYWYVKKL